MWVISSAVVFAEGNLSRVLCLENSVDRKDTVVRLVSLSVSLHPNTNNLQATTGFAGTPPNRRGHTQQCSPVRRGMRRCNVRHFNYTHHLQAQRLYKEYEKSTFRKLTPHATRASFNARVRAGAPTSISTATLQGEVSGEVDHFGDLPTERRGGEALRTADRRGEGWGLWEAH